MDLLFSTRTHHTTIPSLLGRTVPVLTQWKHPTTVQPFSKDSLIDDVELKRVRPLCSVCKGQGRTHKVSHPNNIANKKRNNM